MTQYNVTGMSCAACQARVEKAVSKVPGVKSCAVSLLTNSMGVEGDAPAEAVIRAVTDAGYGASLKNAEKEAGPAAPDYENELKDTETPKIRNRLIASLILLIPLMYVSMGHMLWNWPLPSLLNGNHVAMGLYELLFAAGVMVINQRFFISGFRGLIHRAPNMDTLVAMGAGASFGYSVWALFAMTAAQAAHNEARVMELMDEFYFESAAMILTLITVGKLLEAVSKGRTTNALKELMRLAPKTAVILDGDGNEKEVPVEEVRVHDRFVVRPGSSIPVDGTVIGGSGAVNESALTGESIPVDKAAGDTVSAATINENGYLVCEASRVGRDTTLSQIIQMVSDAAATKAPIAKAADRVSGIFVPAVICIAAAAFVIWLLAGQTAGYALARAISVLVISCPCALGLATPVAIMVGSGMGARHGIMFKTAQSLEETGKVQIIALDKTGTVTKGEPQVRGVFPADGVTEDELLDTAFALESRSEHPLAKAVESYCSGQGRRAAAVEDFRALSGNGLCAVLDGEEVCGGNLELAASKVRIDKDSKDLADRLSESGQTPLFFSRRDRFLGIISVADVIREDSAGAIASLKKMGIHVVMLTGDNAKTAAAIAKEAGVDEAAAGVRPDGKEEIIRKLQAHGKVAMVGDGINDAPALTRADIGIAIGAGTDVALDAADVVLVKSRLSDVASAVRLSRAVLRNIHENLFWAFFYNAIGIPLAAGAFIRAFGLELNPMFGAAAMSLSSFCVVSNALRLNLFRMDDGRKDRPGRGALQGPLLGNGTRDLISGPEQNIINERSEGTMTVRIEGMMCSHCEATVKKALEALPFVESARVSHEEGTAVLTLSGDADEELIRRAVEDKEYTFAGIE
ncbi:MAG: heavy metal translocating P-type ATPase [Lachnospiraceae bacterium]|nr:heavy metal translocating P-type ATPase [Lachnospiraceae bacterium]